MPAIDSIDDRRPWLVIGLGNPGREYEGHRHNIGFVVVDECARRMSGGFRTHKRARAQVLEGRVGSVRTVLVKPATYMNDSGQAVAPLVRRYGVTPEHLVIVHDELDLEPAVLRVKVGGGLAGHNGLRSIKQHLHDDSFLRVRLGVGKPNSKEQGADHVLSRFGKRDREQMAVTVEEAADAVEMILADGVDAAMNRYNARA